MRQRILEASWEVNLEAGRPKVVVEVAEGVAKETLADDMW